ncbi:MAG: transcription elongation factor GreA [Magnetococcales bacterium]|nr:transcription elongation factor GreA [Magnetococcales bacterium]
MAQKIPLTLEGADMLKAELKRRKTVDRAKVIEAIAEARAHGDLSENAEYAAAKEQQSFNEGRIQHLESILANADVIDTSRLRSTKVVFGAKVTVTDEQTDEEVTYYIVGAEEADFDKGKISITSPLARAMIGKEEGDSINVQAPGGVRHYEILSIRF